MPSPDNDRRRLALAGRNAPAMRAVTSFGRIGEFGKQDNGLVAFALCYEALVLFDG